MINNTFQSLRKIMSPDHSLLLSIGLVLISKNFIAAISQQILNSRAILAGTMILFSVVILKEVRTKEATKFIRKNKFLSVLLICNLASIIFTFFSDNSILGISSTNIFLAICTAAFLNYTLFSLDKLNYVLDNLSFFVVFIFGNLFIAESIAYHFEILTNTQIMSAWLHVDSYHNAHLYGVLGKATNSIALIATSGIYLLASSTIPGQKQIFCRIAGWIISGISVFSGESITSTIVFSSVSTAIIFIKIKPQKKYMILLLFFCVLLLYLSPIPGRIEYYIHNADGIIRTFTPVLSGCNSNIIFHGRTIQHCSSNEIHILTRAISHGVFGFLSWITALIFQTCMLFRKASKNVLFFPPLAISITMILLSIHYDPIVSWGNNYLMFLALLYSFPRKEDETFFEIIADK